MPTHHAPSAADQLARDPTSRSPSSAQEQHAQEPGLLRPFPLSKDAKGCPHSASPCPGVPVMSAPEHLGCDGTPHVPQSTWGVTEPHMSALGHTLQWPVFTEWRRRGDRM